MQSANEITEQTIIADILREFPECVSVFDRHGMPCRTCMGAVTGTIAEGAMMHDVDAGTIIDELRECCARADSASQG